MWDAHVHPAWRSPPSPKPSTSDRATPQVVLPRASVQANCHGYPLGSRLARMPPQPLPRHRPTHQMDEGVAEALSRSRPSPRPPLRRRASSDVVVLVVVGLAAAVVGRRAAAADAGMGSCRTARSHAPRVRARRARPPRTLVVAQVQMQLGPASQLEPRSAPPWLESRAGGGEGAAVAFGRLQALNHRATPQMGQREERRTQLGLLLMVHFVAKLSLRLSGLQCLRQPCYRATPQVAQRLEQLLAQTRSA